MQKNKINDKIKWEKVRLIGGEKLSGGQQNGRISYFKIKPSGKEPK